MARAYSRDIREKVMERVDAGDSKKEIAVQFKISRKVIYDWLALREKTGCIAQPVRKKRDREKIIDLGAFKAYVDVSQDKTLVQMGEDWGCCDMTIHRALKLINYTHKKRPLITESEAKRIGKII